MRNQLFRSYTEALGKADATEFTKRISRMNDTEKSVLEQNMAAVQKNILGNRLTPKDEFSFQAGAEVPTPAKPTQAPAAGEKFNPESIFVPVVDGSPVTYQGLVPIEQKAFVVSAPPKGTSSRPGKAPVTQSGSAGNKGPVTKPVPNTPPVEQSFKPEQNIPKATSDKFQKTAQGDLYDPTSGNYYTRNPQSGKYAEIVFGGKTSPLGTNSFNPYQQIMPDAVGNATLDLSNVRVVDNVDGVPIYSEGKNGFRYINDNGVFKRYSPNTTGATAFTDLPMQRDSNLPIQLPMSSMEGATPYSFGARSANQVTEYEAKQSLARKMNEEAARRAAIDGATDVRNTLPMTPGKISFIQPSVRMNEVTVQGQKVMYNQSTGKYYLPTKNRGYYQELILKQ
jgi:hypothetical protein